MFERQEATEKHNRLFKNLMSALLATLLTLGAGLTVAATQPQQALAVDSTTMNVLSSKPYMQKLKLDWSLKAGKVYKLATKVPGLTVKNYGTMEIKGFKKKNVGKDKVKVSFTCVINCTWTPTKKQIHKMGNTMDDMGIHSYGTAQCVPVDYYSGLIIDSDDLEDLGIDIDQESWKSSGVKKYKDSHGCWVNMAKKEWSKFIITYPADYDGLCIGIGGNNVWYTSETDSSFWDGSIPFGDTSYYKKGKLTYRWMRVQ